MLCLLQGVPPPFPPLLTADKCWWIKPPFETENKDTLCWKNYSSPNCKRWQESGKYPVSVKIT